ncbi:MAG TPA: ATP-dependent DNA ligase [Methanoregulaceae archaeon]|nr:ATP-dependent DNA ligase [Methanoregulaceae archaeon]
MLFVNFARCAQQLEGISGRLDMIDVISKVLPTLDDDELPIFIRFIMGRIFPDWSPLKLGIGPSLLYDSMTGIVDASRNDIITDINLTGDVGTAFENILKKRKSATFSARSTQTATIQKPLFEQAEEMTLISVYRDLEKIAKAQGKSSQQVKLNIIRSLLSNASPLEGKYLARLLMEDFRIGVGEGNVREGIARAFSIDSSLVEHAYQALNDLGEVGLLARKGEAALRDVHIRLFHPVKMMLAQQGTIERAIRDNGAMTAEYKYDGSRFQYHKSGSESRIYSRKLENVTDALPDIIRMLDSATDHDVILDGEVIAVKDGRPMPFQTVLRRFRRKHEVVAMAKEIRMIPNVFDILYLDGDTLIDLPIDERRRHLEKSVSDFLAPQVVSDDQAVIENIYQEALTAGHEGIMLKVPDSPYTPGIRGKNWIKIKPTVDTLDLAVIGADWGEGKRAHVFGSFLLACQEEGELVPLSKVATGFSDEQLGEVYDLLKDHVVSRSGKEVRFEPFLVFEVGYSEIQKSINYESGFALRFPRFVRLRDDKSVDETETLESITERFRQQSG